MIDIDERLAARNPVPTPPAATAVQIAEVIGQAKQRAAGRSYRPVRVSKTPWLALTAAAAVAIGVGAGALTSGSDHADHAAGPSSSAPGNSQAVSASQVLALAAKHTVQAGDPVLRPGQYTHVVTEQWLAVRVDQITFLSLGRTEVWAPADRSGIWYWRESGRVGTKFAAPADQRYMKTHHPDEFTPTVFLASGHNGRQDRALGAGPQPSQQPDSKPGWDFPTPQWLATQPRDPRALLAAIEAAQPAPPPGTPTKGDAPTLAFNQIAQTFASGIVPADLRGALYQVITNLPGVQVDSTTTEIDGHRGTAVGRLEPFGFRRQQIIFDAQSGRFLGEREIVVKDDTSDAHPQPGTSSALPHLPVGATYGSTSVTTNVTGNPHLF
jgi:RNA polymerase sigma-70 factor (ECF subfamily)